MESLSLVSTGNGQAYDSPKQLQQAYSTAVSTLQDTLETRFKVAKDTKRGMGKKINRVHWKVKSLKNFVTHSVALAKEGKVHQALEVGNTLTNPNKNLFIAAISTSLLEVGKIDEALQVALKIEGKDSVLVREDSLLAKICKAYSARYPLDSAAAVAAFVKIYISK